MMEKWNWLALDEQKIPSFIDAVFQAISVEKATLSFYPKAQLIRMSLNDFENASYYFIGLENGSLKPLNGSSNSIWQTNETELSEITEENLAEYLLFFCRFVNGDDGPFYIFENIDDPVLDDLKINEEKKAELSKKVKKITIEGRDERNSLLATANVKYGNALFWARFSVTTSGEVEMLDDEQLVALSEKSLEANSSSLGEAK